MHLRHIHGNGQSARYLSFPRLMIRFFIFHQNYFYGWKRTDCDLRFKKDMESRCNCHYNSFLQQPARLVCLAQANIMYAAVAAGGRFFHDTSEKAYCQNTCVHRIGNPHLQIDHQMVQNRKYMRRCISIICFPLIFPSIMTYTILSKHDWSTIVLNFFDFFVKEFFQLSGRKFSNWKLVFKKSGLAYN